MLTKNQWKVIEVPVITYTRVTLMFQCVYIPLDWLTFNFLTAIGLMRIFRVSTYCITWSTTWSSIACVSKIRNSAYFSSQGSVQIPLAGSYFYKIVKHRIIIFWISNSRSFSDILTVLFYSAVIYRALKMW